MDDTYLPHIVSAIALTALWSIIFVLIYALHRQWWSLRGVRRALWIVPLITAVMLALWVFATKKLWIDLAWLSSLVVAVMLAVSLALLLSLPFSGTVLTLERFARWIDGKRRKSQEVDLTRRSMVTKAAAVIPAATVAAAGYGVIYSYVPVRMPNIPLYFPNLPSDFDGLRVLHLSDLHL